MTDTTAAKDLKVGDRIIVGHFTETVASVNDRGTAIYLTTRRQGIGRGTSVRMRLPFEPIHLATD